MICREKKTVLLRSTTSQIRSKHRETKQASINATFIKFPLTEAGNPVLNTAFRMKHLNSISLHQVSQINDVHLKEFTTENLLKFKRIIFTSLHWPGPCHKFLSPKTMLNCNLIFSAPPRSTLPGEGLGEEKPNHILCSRDQITLKKVRFSTPFIQVGRSVVENLN